METRSQPDIPDPEIDRVFMGEALRQAAKACTLIVAGGKLFVVDGLQADAYLVALGSHSPKLLSPVGGINSSWLKAQRVSLMMLKRTWSLLWTSGT